MGNHKILTTLSELQRSYTDETDGKTIVND